MDRREIRLESLNVNGIRAVEKKGFLDWLQRSQPDILCLQETKATPEQLSEELLKPDGYESFFNSGERKGYSGVAVYSKIKPSASLREFPGILDAEGRMIQLEYTDFTLLN
ncbi:MAG: exodeoxyribonuclease III, partial [Candidatus Zixiibacteriota bacterium]